MAIIISSTSYHMYRHCHGASSCYYYVAVFWWKDVSVWLQSQRARNHAFKLNLLTGPCVSSLLPSAGQEANRQIIQPTGNRGFSLKADPRTESF